MLVADAVGGVWDHALTLAAGLLRLAAARVMVVAVGPAPDEARLAAAAAIPGLEHRILDGRLEWMDGGRDWLDAWRGAVAALAAEWRADVVHVNQLGLAGIGHDPRLRAAAPRPAVVLGVHSDVTTWWLWVKDGGQGPATLPDYLYWQRDLARQALRLADVVVCPSAFLARALVACHGITRPPVVIHNAVDAPGQTPPIRREAGLAVVVGRAWDEAKNLAVVADALRHRQEPWHVEVAGDVQEPGRAGSTSPPAAPGLFYHGFLDKGRLAHLYARASICLAPSSYEPFGLAPAEAALAGCAVVANDLPSYREVWGDAARYFRRNDPEDLAAVLDRLQEDAPAVARLAAAARRRVTRRYTHARMVERYLRVYAAAAGGSRVSLEGARRSIEIAGG
jgi:glycosyltransferase involved in cell wall biosynthesis